MNPMITFAKHDKVENVKFQEGTSCYWIEIDEITIFFHKKKELIDFKNKIHSEYETFNKGR